MLERQCEPHPADYGPRGPASMRISSTVDPVSQDVISWHTTLMWMLPQRTIYMDGRPRPSPYAQHTWQGFSTGEWVNEIARRSRHLGLFLVAWALQGFYVVWLPMEVAIIHRSEVRAQTAEMTSPPEPVERTLSSDAGSVRAEESPLHDALRRQPDGDRVDARPRGVRRALA